MQSVRDGAEAEPGQLLCVLFAWGCSVSTQATGEVDSLAVDVAVIKSIVSILGVITVSFECWER